ncbi:hypothetical protein GBA52_016016 [Prunus armeniaca]|nr:hypothetical protein GBA52_016016 [Prunus armeniaca]
MTQDKEEEPKVARGAARGEEEVMERSGSVPVTSRFIQRAKIVSSTPCDWSS